MDFSQVEKYEKQEVTPISEITGFDQEHFPPGEKLSQEQQALLADKLEELLEHYHFKLDFPDNYPAHLRYPFIRKLWSEEQVAVTYGTIHIEFCEMVVCHGYQYVIYLPMCLRSLHHKVKLNPILSHRNHPLYCYICDN